MAMRCQGSPQERVALPLLVVMAQQRRRIARDTDSPHLKLIAELYDKCDIVLLQACARAGPARVPERLLETHLFVTTTWQLGLCL